MAPVSPGCHVTRPDVQDWDMHPVGFRRSLSEFRNLMNSVCFPVGDLALDLRV